MKLTTLTALSPIDGRYANKTEQLRPLLSEYGLIRHRLIVEIRWLECMAEHDGIKEVPHLSPNAQQFLQQIIDDFNIHTAQAVKDIEQTTNHDVKACEYYLKQTCEQHPELSKLSEFFHFACTSEDINNLAYALMLKQARTDFILPLVDKILSTCQQLSTDHALTPMLAHTHGQAASPTTVGKEFANVGKRLHRAREQLSKVTLFGKFNGATGNFNAHIAAYPDIDWMNLSQRFVNSLGLIPNPYTTQIEPHDYIAEYAHSLVRMHNIMIDFNRDLWGYIALGYFKQRSFANEVGSSTMPHKINPIDFENSEGNLLLANALLTCLANQLPISRWQRDLVDSTLLRNLSTAIGHSLVAYQANLKGLNKLEVNQDVLDTDLDANWEVLGEALQTVMRRYRIESPYEQLKGLTRGKKITSRELHAFIDGLAIPDPVKHDLKQLTPSHYTGLASELTEKACSLVNPGCVD